MLGGCILISKKDRKRWDDPNYDFFKTKSLTIKDGTLIKCRSTDTWAFVPERVHSIGDGAFRGRTNNLFVFLTGGVTKIGAEAFRDSAIQIIADRTVYDECERNTKKPFVNRLNEGLQEIGEHAFDNCVDLTEIILPETVIQIGAYAFAKCTYLKSATTGSVTDVPDGCFQLCRQLKTVKLSSCARRIGKLAFDGCVAVKEMVLPSTLEIIDLCAFQFCKTLKTIVLPHGLKHIGAQAFLGCEKLESVTIPDSVNEIEYKAFLGCRYLLEVTLSKNLKTIPTGCFRDCFQLTDVNIPNGVTTIESDAFRGCKRLITVTIPSSVQTIGKAVFEGCPNIVIRGKSGSVAEEYANQNQIAFTAI